MPRSASPLTVVDALHKLMDDSFVLALSIFFSVALRDAFICLREEISVQTVRGCGLWVTLWYDL